MEAAAARGCRTGPGARWLQALLPTRPPRATAWRPRGAVRCAPLRPGPHGSPFRRNRQDFHLVLALGAGRCSRSPQHVPWEPGRVLPPPRDPSPQDGPASLQVPPHRGVRLRPESSWAHEAPAQLFLPPPASRGVKGRGRREKPAQDGQSSPPPQWRRRLQRQQPSGGFQRGSN